MKGGMFCDVFGKSVRNRILEFYLEMRELDFSIGDLVKETDLNRASAYLVMEKLVSGKIIVPTRIVSGAQLYQLNRKSKEVKVLEGAFDQVLRSLVKRKISVRNR
jgi:anthranilate phosphoribosyltransferase